MQISRANETAASDLHLLVLQEVFECYTRPAEHLCLGGHSPVATLTEKLSQKTAPGSSAVPASEHLGDCGAVHPHCLWGWKAGTGLGSHIESQCSGLDSGALGVQPQMNPIPGGVSSSAA